MNLSTILAADGHQVRNDVKICIEPELNYMTCKIAKTWAAYKSKYPHTKSKHPGDFFYGFFALQKPARVDTQNISWILTYIS
jgi:hypothetical protein